MAISFRKISSLEPVVNYLVDTIKQRLERDQRVLWLVPGGSSIAVAVQVSQKLSKNNLQNLTATLTDERHGEVGHPDSNWQQLHEAGFKLPGANEVPILNGSSVEATIERFDKILAREIKRADYKLGFIGIGPDSHIAGIKPHSPATSAKAMATGYDWDDYRRITMTFPAIELMDTVVTYLAGEAKQTATLALTKNAPLAEVPSQILKRAKEAIIFNDRIDQ